MHFVCPFGGFLLNSGLQLFMLAIICHLSVHRLCCHCCSHCCSNCIPALVLCHCCCMLCVLLSFHPPSVGCSVSMLLLFLSLCHMHCFHSVCAHNCLFLFFMRFNNNNKIIGNKIHKIFLCVVNSKEQSSDQKHLE